MSRVVRYSLLAACLLWAAGAAAQYYHWGSSPVGTKWRQIATPDLRVIYPREFESAARRTMWYLDTVRTHIDYGFRHGTMRSPVVIHTQNMVGNGMVMWAPHRIELLSAPGASYSEPWLKQLAIHEYRHNVQYNNLRRGVMRPLMWLLGEQVGFLGTGQFSIYFLEGDAVMAETEMSAFGRGLQPSWTMHYRAMGSVGTPEHSDDYWHSGSFRDHVPDHYRLGYQMARWSYNRFGTVVWDDVANYVARNPQLVVPLATALKKHWGITQKQMFHQTFADLNAYWSSLPRVEDSSLRVPVGRAGPGSRYVTWRWPMWVDADTLVAFKSDMMNTGRIVRVDVASGHEELLTPTGSVSSRPVLSGGGGGAGGGGGVIWWTEFRRSLIWDQKVGSRLVSYDLATGQKLTHREGFGDDQVLYPTPTDGDLAYVAFDYSARYTIVRGDERLLLPADIEVTGLAWDDVTRALYFTGLDDGGMFLGAVEGNDFRRLTPSRHITISDLRAGGGRLHFGSIVSGKDEAHAYDLATGTEYRLSESTYGSFHPSMPVGGRIALTTYDRNGYHLATQNIAGARVQQQRTLPLDLVNPPWKRWNIAKMDSLVYTPAAEARSIKTRPARRFNKFAGMIHPHSWLPIDFYPPRAETDRTIHLGATVISQSLLSDAVTWLAYGWTGRRGPNATGGSMLRGGISYNGLGPTLDLDFSWGGGPQLLYTPLPQWTGRELKAQLSLTARLSLPLTVSSGAWHSSVTPSAEYHYNNGLLFIPSGGGGGNGDGGGGELDPITGDGGGGGGTAGNITRGVERLSLSVGYSGQTRMAQGEFLPRWGVSARVGHVSNPFNGDFRDLVSASLGLWLPGAVRPHVTRLRAAWQRSTGGGVFGFRMKEVFPRGARYDFSASEWRSGSVDYQLPVWYPERGIPGIIYFKRLRVNLFADYALWRGPAATGSSGGGGAASGSSGGVGGAGGGASAGVGGWNRLHSWGGDLIVDFSPLRMPDTNHFSAVITLARPSDRRGIWFNFALQMPL